MSKPKRKLVFHRDGTLTVWGRFAWRRMTWKDWNNSPNLWPHFSSEERALIERHFDLPRPRPKAP